MEDIILLSRLAAGMFAIGLMVLTVCVACGQAYPNKPIRIVTAAAGGSGDFAARLIAQGIAGPLGRPVIVDNRPAIVAIETAAKALPDGYTLLYIGSTFWTWPLLLDHVSYDPVRDFSAITLAATAPLVVVVHPSVPVSSIEALIVLAKARPGELNYASSGSGGATHLAAELFKSMTTVNIVRISYKGAAAALNDLISGHVQLMFPSAVEVVPHIRSGRLKALAIASTQSFPLFPGLPTVATSGLPGFDAESPSGVFAPAGTSAAIINRLNQEIAQGLRRQDAKEKFLDIGMQTIGSSPEQLAAVVKSEMSKWGQVIRNAGIKIN